MHLRQRGQVGSAIMAFAVVATFVLGWRIAVASVGAAIVLAVAFVAVRKRQRKAAFTPDSFNGPLGEIDQHRR